LGEREFQRKTAKKRTASRETTEYSLIGKFRNRFHRSAAKGKTGEIEKRRKDDGKNGANKSAKIGVKRRSRRFFASNRAPVACASDDSGYNKTSDVALIFEKRTTVEYRRNERAARGSVEIFDGDAVFPCF